MMNNIQIPEVSSVKSRFKQKGFRFHYSTFPFFFPPFSSFLSFCLFFLFSLSLFSSIFFFFCSCLSFLFLSLSFSFFLCFSLDPLVSANQYKVKNSFCPNGRGPFLDNSTPSTAPEWLHEDENDGTSSHSPISTHLNTWGWFDWLTDYLFI